ncbi:hypothetical protein Hamer_G000341 [Homarus americanus]|uniref:Uncharacterized protein n=1 Tax=Homarus americanus TaxID=6706 RepID=A0A8J5NAP9_HOMAM|nr:hypothetical protein Hamer_G000341 [Homarus americanus]
MTQIANMNSELEVTYHKLRGELAEHGIKELSAEYVIEARAHGEFVGQGTFGECYLIKGPTESHKFSKSEVMFTKDRSLVVKDEHTWSNGASPTHKVAMTHLLMNCSDAKVTGRRLWCLTEKIVISSEARENLRQHMSPNLLERQGAEDVDPVRASVSYEVRE